VLLGTFSLLAASVANAQTSTCEVPFLAEDNLTDLTWDTDWVPKGEKIQVRLIFTAKAGISASLPSTATLDRSGPLGYAGKQGAGELKMGLWTHLDAKYRLTDLSWEGIKLDHEGTLPVPKSFHDTVNNIIEDKASFTPLILEGAPERPVKVSLSTPKKTLLTLTVVSVSIGIAKVTVTVPLKVKAILNCDLEGTRVESTPEGASAPLLHTAEGQSVSWPQSGALEVKGKAVYVGKRKLGIDLVLYPSIKVEAKAKIGGLFEEKKTWDVIEFEESMTLYDQSSSWTFPPQPLLFSFPPVPGSDGGGPTPVDEAGVHLPRGDGGKVSPPTEAGGPGATGGTTSGGCCRVGGDSPSLQASTLLLLLLVLGVAWRRRP